MKAMESEGGADAEWNKDILALMDAVDEYIELPKRPIDKDFLLPIEDVFTISG